MGKATFGAGCFWHVEEAFSKLKGVVKITVGYAGGHFHNPSYRDVCGGATGHAEVVQIEYDPTQTSYEGLLNIFWQIHDPTTRNRQGPDVGTQYRSVILFHNSQQAQEALISKEKLEATGRFSHPIVTEILPAREFYAAEEYHQHYFERLRRNSSCSVK